MKRIIKSFAVDTTYLATTLGLVCYVNGAIDGTWWLRYPGLLLFCVGLLRITDKKAAA